MKPEPSRHRKFLSTCLLGLAATTGSALAQFPEPLLYYSFDEPGGATTAVDLSENNFDGTVVGNVAFGVPGAPSGSTPSGAAQFSVGGSNGVLNVSTLNVPTHLGKRDGTPEQADQSYTMACWIRPDAASLSGEHFFVGQSTQGIHNGLRGSGQLHQAHWANDHYADTQLTADQWVHVTFTYDGITNTGTIYLNGVQDSAPTSKDGPNGDGNLYLGARQGANNGGLGEAHYIGLIDDFVIFQEVLPQNLITLLANGQSPVLIDDEDNDNLPDAYERTIVGSDDLTILNGDGVADADLDTLSDLEEFEETKTNPLEADTDNDQLDDNEEIDNGNGSITDPLDPDSDDDGVSDGEEVLGLLNDAFGNESTDPTEVDSDGDGALDSYELNNGFDPNSGESKPDFLLIPPSFEPIRYPGLGNYVPGEAGWDFQQNFYPAAVIFLDQAQQNYEVHTSGSPQPLESGLSVQPYLDHGDGNTISQSNFPFPEGGGDNFTVRANGYVEFTQGGNYQLHHGSDDTVYAVIDTGTDSSTVAENNCCPGEVRKGIRIGAPGFYPIDFVFGEQGGGEWLDFGISGPGITGTVALGDVAAGSPAVFQIGIDPTDSDGDSIPDAYEQIFFPDDLTQLGSGDFDSDGIDDVDEFLNRTDPTESDSDGDGLDDGEEETRGTNPLNPDSDGDTLSDGDEVNGVGGFVSDPLQADSDGDGFNDAVEILNGSNPNQAGSIPSTSLPIVDDFEDGLLNSADWMVNLNDIPAGADVVEENGHLSLIGRGHLVTVGEFDPEEVGGLSITGEWTFVQGDDFIQILTRTDGVPDPGNCCGETTSGVEFYAFQGDNSVQIRTRGIDHTVANELQTGAIILTVGSTYEFTIIDDGLGALSFTLQEQGNPANTTTVTAELIADTSPHNHVAFHNRETGRISQLETVTIQSLVEQETGIEIQSLTLDQETGEMSLTWESRPDENFRIAVSAEMRDWTENELIDSIRASDVGETTTFNFNRSALAGIETDGKAFFRVERLED